MYYYALFTINRPLINPRLAYSSREPSRGSSREGSQSVSSSNTNRLLTTSREVTNEDLIFDRVEI